jgi:biopolymer transport protein ExbD
MKLKVLISVVLLSLALPAAADMRIVENAYEIALNDLRLPRAEGGTIAFKECRKCNYVRLRVAADTRYQINGKAVPLDKFREAVAEVEDPDQKAVTVLHHLKRNQVTAVSVNL